MFGVYNDGVITLVSVYAGGSGKRVTIWDAFRVATFNGAERRFREKRGVAGPIQGVVAF